MINIKPVIVSNLKANSELVALLKGDHIYRQYPAESVDFNKHSLIVYSEIGNKPLAKGDEVELVAKITMQIDVWSLSSTSDIAAIVDLVMTGIGGERVDAPDDDENAPKQCKAMVYEFVVDNEGTIF
jgi:hypothetical protein